MDRIEFTRIVDQYYDNVKRIAFAGCKNIYDAEEMLEGLNKFILAGEDYYDFVIQADLPEAVKDDYIKAYEDAYIREIITAQNHPYPGDSSSEDKYAWISIINEQVEQYKNLVF